MGWVCLLLRLLDLGNETDLLLALKLRDEVEALLSLSLDEKRLLNVCAVWWLLFVRVILDADLEVTAVFDLVLIFLFFRLLVRLRAPPAELLVHGRSLS